jgi:hypothetical protein
MEGTNYLIHPIADLRVYERGSKARYGSSSVIDLSFTILIMEKMKLQAISRILNFKEPTPISTLTDKPALILTANLS